MIAGMSVIKTQYFRATQSNWSQSGREYLCYRFICKVAKHSNKAVNCQIEAYKL